MLTDIEKQLFGELIKDYDAPELLSWAPIDWLLTISNPDYLSTTTIAKGEPNERVGLEELFEMMLRDGMHEPMVVAFGRDTGRYRLDEGNQRVQVMKNTMLPECRLLALLVRRIYCIPRTACTMVLTGL